MNDVQSAAVVAAVSACIGAGVGVFFQALGGEPLAGGLLPGLVSGAAIGALSRAAFYLVYGVFRKTPVLAFFSVSLIIGAGTSFFCFLWSVSCPVPFLPIVAVSEAAGIAATAVFFRSYRRLNQKLVEKKQTLSR